MADVSLYSGDLDGANDYAVRLSRLAASSDNSQLRLWSVATRLWINRRLGLDEESIALANALDPDWLREVRSSEGLMVATCRASLAHALVRRGEFARAAEIADLALQGGGFGQSPFFWEFELWSSLVGTYCVLWDATDSVVEHQRYETMIRAALASLRSLSTRLTLARPDHLLARGLLEDRLGKHGAAVRHLRRAAALSDKLGMPYTAGRAYFELARCQPDGSDAELALEHAEGRFERIGARVDLAAVRSEQVSRQGSPNAPSSELP
jgi:tetratricopeptide (TPR) repeat protein